MLSCNQRRSGLPCEGFSLRRLQLSDCKMNPDWLRVRENDSRLNVTSECNHEIPHVSLLDSMEEPLTAQGAFRKQNTCHDLERG